MLKDYKNIILFGLFLMLSVSSYSFRLDNILFNQRMDSESGGYSQSYLVNNSLEKQRYKINILKGKTRDGSAYIQVYPKIITVEPQSRGLIKIFAQAPTTLPKGEYDFRLQFKPISIPVLAKAKSGNKISGTSNIGIAPIVPMKGYIGEVNFAEAITFTDIKVIKNSQDKGSIVKGKISDNSFAGIDFGAEAYGKDDFFYGSAYIGDIPAHTKDKEIELKFPMIANPSDLKKIIFYRTPADKRIVLKEIKII